MAGSRRKLFCRGSRVLQYSGVHLFKTALQYSLLGSSVLQYTALYCGMRQGYLCCKTGGCVATRRWVGALGARGAQAGTGGARRRQARWAPRRQGLARAGSGTAWAHRRARRHGTGARARGSKRAGRARPGHWAGGLGARASYGLCTRCTRPVFDLV